MPTWRTVQYQVEAYRYEVSARPVGWRDKRIIRTVVPYWTGAVVQARITIKSLDGNTPVVLRWRSDIERRQLVESKSERITDFPHTFTTRPEFVSAADKYRYEVLLDGNWANVAEFEAGSKDVTMEKVLIGLGGAFVGALISLITLLASQ